MLLEIILMEFNYSLNVTVNPELHFTLTKVETTQGVNCMGRIVFILLQIWKSE